MSMDDMTHKTKEEIGFANFQFDAKASHCTPEAKDMDMMYNNYYLMQQENQVPASPSKMSYTLGEYDNQVLHNSDKPEDFGMEVTGNSYTRKQRFTMTEFGSYMHELFEQAVLHKLSDYTLAKSKLDDDVVIELNEVEEGYAVTLFNRFLGIIDHNAEYLTEHVVKAPVAGILYEGSADLIELHSDDSFTVIDYKNYSKLTEQDIQAHLNQCRIYAAAYARQTGKKVREIKVHYPMQDLTESETYVD